MPTPVISATSAALAHVPGLLRHGSKPSRELRRTPELMEQFLGSLRTFEQAVAYGPHQAFLAALHPRDLPERPWVAAPANGEGRFAGAGELMPEEEFLGLMAAVDDFGLVRLGKDEAGAIGERLSRHPLAEHLDLEKVAAAGDDAEAVAAEKGALPLHLGAAHLAGAMRRANESDQALTAEVVLENLAGKASATLALLHLLPDTGAFGRKMQLAELDYLVGSTAAATALAENYVGLPFDGAPVDRGSPR